MLDSSKMVQSQKKNLWGKNSLSETYKTLWMAHASSFICIFKWRDSCKKTCFRNHYCVWHSQCMSHCCFLVWILTKLYTYLLYNGARHRIILFRYFTEWYIVVLVNTKTAMYTQYYNIITIKPLSYSYHHHQHHKKAPMTVRIHLIMAR